MPGEPWCVDYLNVDGRTAEIHGWALAPGGNHRDVTFCLNGREFEVIEYPRVRPDLARAYFHTPHARWSGFRCRTTVTEAQVLFGDRFARVDFVCKTTGEPFRDESAYYFGNPLLETLPFPDADRMRRVHGGDSRMSFFLEGCTNFAKLNNALSKYSAGGFSGRESILDWGCGCGRLTRHFAGLKGRIVGADIDADNVKWCADNLPFGAFQAIPLNPPTAIAADTFDLVIGVSVFTHLGENDQDRWLAELQRISRSGGIVLVSTHGNAAVSRADGWSLDLLKIWMQRGILDGPNHDLDSVLTGASDYYRNAYHTVDYINAHWSRYFEIVDIIPAYIGNFQDLVVMRRR
jgi:2-polyprenyl-3-methyl-5-hydroxy-6-metoxy-1,4-benzoquinol methylase